MTRLLFFFAACGLFFSIHAQPSRWHFVQYLLAKKNFDEAAYVLQQIGANAPPGRADTVHLWLARIFYEQQQIPEAIQFYDRVSARMPFLYREAVFYGAFLAAHQKDFTDATQRLVRVPADSATEALLQSQRAGLYLLQRDLTRTDSLLRMLPPDHPLHAQRQLAAGQKQKSPVVAGLLSAALPGAGRWYAGNRGQAIYTFLISLVAGLQAYEAWDRAGPQSFRFIAYGALFTSVYIASIWGSTLSVKVKRDQVNEQINQQILVDMHIALRSRFR